MSAASSISRSVILTLLLAAILATTLAAGIKAGADAKFPGPMVRHRESAAIAITYLRYGTWLGYASYRAVDKRLNDLGLSMEPRIVQKFGGSMEDLMQRPEVMDAALAGALDIPNPAADGLYFMDNDDKGMSLFYIFCFSLFGYKIAGFFYGYMLLLSISAALYCFAFFRRPDILFVGLAVAAAHFAGVLVCQQFEPDVNVVHSSRFIGLMSIFASLHLSFLVATRVRPSPGAIIPAIGQTILLVLIFIARSSALWESFPIFLVAALLWMRVPPFRIRRPVLWPAGLGALSIIALMMNNAFLLHPHYHSPAATSGHVFWHALALGLHNNPARAKYGIPSNVEPWTDTVAHIVFEHEIAKLGKTWADFRTGDPDAEALEGIDLAWRSYDAVLREAVLRTIREDPLYALQSFLIYQPLSIARTLFSPTLFDWGRILDWRILAALAIGALAAAPAMRRFGRAEALTLGATLVFSLAPVVIVAPTTNRVLEVYVVLLTCGLVATVTLLGLVWPPRASRSS